MSAPTTTADGDQDAAPTFAEALAEAAESLRYAADKNVPIEAADCHTRIADRWLALAALLRP